MKTFWKLLEKSVIVRGALAILVTIVWAILILASRDVPGVVYILLGSAWSYFFATGAPKDLVDVLRSERDCT